MITIILICSMLKKACNKCCTKLRLITCQVLYLVPLCTLIISCYVVSYPSVLFLVYVLTMLCNTFVSKCRNALTVTLKHILTFSHSSVLIMVDIQFHRTLYGKWKCIWYSALLNIKWFVCWGIIPSVG